MLIAPRISTAALLLALAASCTSAPVQAQQAASTTLLSRSGTSPAIATDGRGGFVLVWADRGADSLTDILARILPKGARLPPAPFVVNGGASRSQDAPAVSVDAAGRFAVVWQDGLEQLGGIPATGGSRVVGAAFGAAGGRQSGEFRLSTAEVGQQVRPRVARLENGDFVAAWVEERFPRAAIKAARFSAQGSPLGPEMEMKAGGEINLGAQVASFPGGFAVGWTEFFGCPGGRSAAFLGAVARFDAEGQPTGRIYRAGSASCDVSSGPGALDALSGSRAGALAAFAGPREAVQRFAPSGEPVGGRFNLPATTCTEGRCTFLVALAMDNFGRFAMIWEMSAAGEDSFAAQLFNPRGKPLTGLVPFSGEPFQSAAAPAAALADDGTLAVVWRRESSDPDRRGLYLTRLRLP